MKRAPRVMGIALGSVLVLGLTAVIAINLYVQSAPVQARIAAAVEPALGPLKIGRAGWTPWGGLQLRDIESQPAFDTRLQADRLVLRVDLLPLLGRRVNIREFRIEGPTLAIDRSATEQAATAPIVPVPSPTVSPGSAGSSTGESRLSFATKSRPPVVVSVQRAGIRDGRLVLRDGRGVPLLTLEGIAVRSYGPSATEARGEFSIASAAFRNAVRLTDVRGPFRYRGDRLELSDLRGHAAGGELKGAVELGGLGGEPIGRGQLELVALDLAALVEEAGGPVGRASGKLHGRMVLEGSLSDPATLGGNGSLRLEEGAFRQYELLQTLGRALDIQELMEIRFRAADADFRVETGRMRLDRLELASDNLRVQAVGTIEPDGRLALDAGLLLNRPIARRLPSVAKENMVDVEGMEGWRRLDFRVGGTLADPEADLLERLVGKELERKWRDLRRGLFGGEDDRKRPRAKTSSKSSPKPVVPAGKSGAEPSPPSVPGP